MDNSSTKGPHFFWLLLPWLTAVAVFVGYATGLADWIFNRVPMIRFQENTGWGMLLVTLFSSFRWAYLRLGIKSPGAEIPMAKIIGLTILITIAQCCVAFGVTFVGCLVAVGGLH